MKLTSLGAPGPTAMTVASGRGLEVAEVGRKIPEAVFYSPGKVGRREEERRESARELEVREG